MLGKCRCEVSSHRLQLHVDLLVTCWSLSFTLTQVPSGGCIECMGWFHNASCVDECKGSELLGSSGPRNPSYHNAATSLQTFGNFSLKPLK